MTAESGPEAERRVFVRVAKDFCDFVETASAMSLSERLQVGRRRLAELVAAGSALPLAEAMSDEILLTDAAPASWPGFGRHDIYWEIFDPYVDEERVAGSLSDDFLEIYCDLKRGLTSFDAGGHEDAFWEWRFHFDHHWGEHAVDALRALQRACRAIGNAPPLSGSGEGPRVLVRTGGLVEETRISIRIHGPDVDPSATSEALGVTATSHHLAGEPRKSGPPWRAGAWLLTVVGKAPRGPEEVAEELLRALPAPDAAPWTELRAKHQIQVMVALFMSGRNRGYVMSEEVLRRLAGIAGSVDFDIYVD